MCVKENKEGNINWKNEDVLFKFTVMSNYNLNTMRFQISFTSSYIITPKCMQLLPLILFYSEPLLSHQCATH